ncbi:MAG: serine/threonine-protein kinase [Pirellulaceae bacterium]
MPSPVPADDELTASQQQRIVDQLDAFEQELRGGGRPRIEAFLQRVDAALQRHLLFDLVRLEQELLGPGRRTTLEQYQRRFPQHQELLLAAVREVHGSETTAVDLSPGRVGMMHVGMVHGTPPSLESETAELLQTRLRAVSLVLVVALGFFLIRMLVIQDTQLVWLRSGVFLTALLCLARLVAARSPTLVELRTLEMLLIFANGSQSVALQVVGMLEGAAAGDAVLANNTMLFAFATWIAANMAYAVFIPNTWRRAALLLVPAAVVPLVVAEVLFLGDARIASMVDPRGIHAAALLTLIASGASIFGAYTSHALRKQAFLARRFGQYRLKRPLGSGGMGEVYLAEHQLLKRPCAIKLIRPGFDTNADVVARFEREVQATARLSHWNTVEIFDYGRTEDGAFYYVMELLSGKSLQQLVDRYGPMPPPRVVYLLAQVCDGLAEAHDAGLIHQDIKPANIFAAHCGGLHDVAKVLDFGLVHETTNEARSTKDSQSARRVTGTPRYMAPEQARAAPPDARTDIYSLGATAYFLLTGEPVFRRATTMETLRAHADDEPTPPSTHRADLPADVEAVVLRCLAKSPEARFADVRAMKEALLACECARQWNAETAAHWWRDRRREAPSTDDVD